jgi:hypothetical protein
MSDNSIAAIWRQIFRSIWKDFETRFKHILDSLSQHRQLIVEQAQLLHFQQSQIDLQSLMLHIQQYEHDRSERMILLEKEAKYEEDKKYLTVLEWFSGADSTVLDHDTFRGIRSQYAGSGDWILKDEKVQNWMEPDTPESSVLWINGIPGAGRPSKFFLPLFGHAIALRHFLNLNRKDDSGICYHRRLYKRHYTHHRIFLLQRK